MAAERWTKDQRQRYGSHLSVGVGERLEYSHMGGTEIPKVVVSGPSRSGFLAAVEGLRRTSVMDRLEGITGRKKKEKGVALSYLMFSSSGETICIEVELDSGGPSRQWVSVSSVFPSATFFEEEISSTFGVRFLGDGCK